MHVEIRDPDDKIILSKVYSSEGKFTFTSHMPGEHVICLYSNSTKWFSGSQLRVHLDIQVMQCLCGKIFMHCTFRIDCFMVFYNCANANA